MKNKTIICHFFNEEYLLPWWLNHHKQIFNDGLLINYGSTDNSVNIIKTICPNWTIVNTRNEYFGAVQTDQEVQDYEKNIEGQRIALNVTEFFIGNIRLLEEIDHPLFVRMASMADPIQLHNTYPDVNKSLTSQRHFGINPDKHNVAGARLYHSLRNIVYPAGRHFWYEKNTNDFMILRYKHSPWNDKFIQRKMQIGAKQLPSDLTRGCGFHHQFNVQQLEQEKNEYLPKSEDLLPIISKFEYWSY